MPVHPRALRSLTSLALCALPLVLLGPIGSTNATAKTLKIATLMPEGSGFVTEMRQAGENIDSRTEGRVRLKFYPGGVMGNDKTVMRKMRIGQIHGAALPSGPLASVFPDIEIYSLPLFGRVEIQVVLAADTLGVSRLEGRIPQRPVQGNVVGNEAVPRFIVAQVKVLPCLLAQGVGVLRDDRPRGAVQPLP